MLKNSLSSLVELCIKSLSLNELRVVIGELPLLKVFKNNFSPQRGGMGFVFSVNETLISYQKLSLHSCIYLSGLLAYFWCKVYSLGSRGILIELHTNALNLNTVVILKPMLGVATA